MPTDLYAVLGVPRTATADEIKKTYRRLAKKLHPDVNPGNKRSEDRFKEVGSAFEVLGDPARRKLYDEFGEAALRSGFDEAKVRAYQRATEAGGGGRFGGRDPFSGFGGGGDPGGAGGRPGGFDPNDLGDLFGDLFARRQGGRARRARAEPVIGADIESELPVSLRDAVLGAERELSVTRPATCPRCHGEPTAGQICGRCGGTGTIAEPTRLKVKIPAGVETGSRIRLPGQGSPGDRGGDPGDLYLQVRIEPHPVLLVDGHDLTLPLPVTVSEALLGAEVTVPTFEGPVRLKVPPGSQGGRKLRLRARGLPSIKPGQGAARGDLYVVLQIHLPPDGEEARAAVAALEKLYDADVRRDLAL
jgi:molecular chaperone DnaJ